MNACRPPILIHLDERVGHVPVDVHNRLVDVVNALTQVVEALADRVWRIEDLLELDGDLPPWMDVDVKDGLL